MSKITCPDCGTKIEILPVSRLILSWSDRPMDDPRPGLVCRVVRNSGGLSLLLTQRLPDRPNRLSVAVPVRVGPPIVPGGEQEGAGYEVTAFGLERIGPGVWALSPSLVIGNLHAWVMLCDVPEPAPWAADRAAGEGTT